MALTCCVFSLQQCSIGFKLNLCMFFAVFVLSMCWTELTTNKNKKSKQSKINLCYPLHPVHKCTCQGNNSWKTAYGYKRASFIRTPWVAYIDPTCKWRLFSSLVGSFHVNSHVLSFNSRQYYVYVTDTRCKRVGTQCWMFW